MLDIGKDQIKALLDFQSTAQSIREAYIASSAGHVQTPDVMHLGFPEANGDCHIKAGHIEGTDTFVVKIASGFYDNPQNGLPSSIGMMLAFSCRTGAPVAILKDEGWLTDVRTGIGGALATLALSRSYAKEVLILGTGIQAGIQANCLVGLCGHRQFQFTIWGRNEEKAESLARSLSSEGKRARFTTRLEQAVRTADIIITTTPSSQALIEAHWVQPGTHITAIGADSPGKQELATNLVLSADLLVCDMKRQSLAHGEFQHAAAHDPGLTIVELGQVLSGQHVGRPSATAITIADLTGIAAQDVSIAQAVIAAAQSSTEFKDSQ